MRRGDQRRGPRALVADQDVEPGRARHVAGDPVGAAFAEDHVVIAATVQAVVAGATVGVRNDVARRARDRAVVAEDHVVASVADDQVGDVVDAGQVREVRDAADQAVVATAAEDDVAAAAALDVVGVLLAEQDVVVRVAVDRVVAGAAERDVVATLPVDQVVIRAAEQRVGTRSTEQRDRADDPVVAEQRVVAAVARQVVVAQAGCVFLGGLLAATDHLVGAGAAIHRVVALAADHVVVVGLAGAEHRLRPDLEARIAEHPVVAVVAVQLVVADAAGEQVVALAAVDLVGAVGAGARRARVAEQAVVAGVGGQRVHVELRIEAGRQVGVAVDRVVALAALDQIVLVAAGKQVVAVAAVQLVDTRRAPIRSSPRLPYRLSLPGPPKITSARSPVLSTASVPLPP